MKFRDFFRKSTKLKVAYNRKRQRGQSAMLDVGLASLIAASLIASLTMSLGNYQQNQAVIAAAQNQRQLGANLAAYIQANYSAFLNATQNTSQSCSPLQASGYGIYILQPTTTFPNNASPGSCVAEPNLFPPNSDILSTYNVYGNRFNDFYILVVKNQTNSQNQPYLRALLIAEPVTANPTDSTAASIAENIGLTGAYRPGPTNPQGAITSTGGQFTIQNSNWASLINQDADVDNISYLINATDDQNLQRYSSSVDPTPNKMDATMYMSGTDSATGQGVNLALDGPVVQKGSVLASLRQAYSFLPSSQPYQPTNAVLGARQIDTQTLTPGTSILTYPTNAAEQQAESANGTTIADTGTQAFEDDTILDNANFDVTAGYRLTAADGIHITATGAPSGPSGNPGIINDLNTSANGQEVDINNGDAGDPAAVILPGIQWDAANGSGLMIFNGTNPYPPPGGSPTEFWLGTYAGSNADNGVVGFEADGGMRAPIYYDNKNSTYYMAPAGNTNLAGNVTNGGSVYSGCNNIVGTNLASVQGQENEINAVTAGTSGAPNPDFNTCGNIIGNNIVATGYIDDSNGIYSGGDITSTTSITAFGYLDTQLLATAGTPCVGNNTNNNQFSQTANISQVYGALAVDKRTGQPLWCMPPTTIASGVSTPVFTSGVGTWTDLQLNGFTHEYTTTVSALAPVTGTNTNAGAMMISTNCPTTIPGLGLGYRVKITDTTTGILLAHSLINEGGQSAGIYTVPSASAIIPPGDRFELTYSEVGGSGSTETCNFNETY